MTYRAADDEPLNLAQYDLPTWNGVPRKSYIICSTQRTGSNYLCGLLIRDGGFGMPFEYFHASRGGGPLEERLGLPEGTDFSTYLSAVIRIRTSPNGVFGTKMHAAQMIEALKAGAIQKYLPGVKFIFLKREDVFAQAVSFAIARQTDQWTSHGEVVNEPVYDWDMLRNCLNSILSSYKAWGQFFAGNRIQPLALTYEGIQADPQKAVAAVAGLLDVPFAGADSEEPLFYQRQGGQRNVEWARRFKEDCIAAGILKAA